MVKTLFNIIWLFVSLSTSAHASDFDVLNGDLEQNVRIAASDEVHAFSTPYHLFFNIESEDFSVVSNPSTKPSQPNEISVDKVGVGYLSNHLSLLQGIQYTIVAYNDFKILHLRKTLYPFHSFW